MFLARPPCLATSGWLPWCRILGLVTLERSRKYRPIAQVAGLASSLSLGVTGV